MAEWKPVGTVYQRSGGGGDEGLPVLGGLFLMFLFCAGLGGGCGNATPRYERPVQQVQAEQEDADSDD